MVERTKSIAVRSRGKLSALSWLLLTCGLAAPICATSGYTESKVLILQSGDSRFKQGELQPLSAAVRLAPGEVLRLITPSGQVAKIQGPHSGSIGSALRDEGSVESLVRDLAPVVRGRGKGRHELGGWRSAADDSGPPRYRETVVRIIIGESGSYCIAPGQKLAFWRPTAPTSPQVLTIEILGNGITKVVWPEGVQELALPADILKTQPRRISLPSYDHAGATRARLLFGKHGDAPAEQLNWYHRQGCESQFDSALRYYQTF